MFRHFDAILKNPLTLRSGQVLRSLSDAVVLMTDLPEFPRLRPTWQLACEAPDRAARTGTTPDLETATCELELALIGDRMASNAALYDLPGAMRIQVTADHVLVAGADEPCRDIIRVGLRPKRATGSRSRASLPPRRRLRAGTPRPHPA